MTSDRFTVRRDGAITRLTLCRGDDGNTLAPPDMRALGAAISAAGSAADCKLVVVSGEGADFCLGRRIVAGVTRPAQARAFRERVADAILGVYEDLRRCPVPVLTAVQGQAKGFGCAFAAQSDSPSPIPTPASACRKWTPIYHLPWPSRRVYRRCRQKLFYIWF
ncbi:MAG: enoyl-CoA hydratase/isomerase family protein [Rhodospirillaceae bacterium]